MKKALILGGFARNPAAAVSGSRLPEALRSSAANQRSVSYLRPFCEFGNRLPENLGIFGGRGIWTPVSGEPYLRRMRKDAAMRFLRLLLVTIAFTAAACDDFEPPTAPRERSLAGSWIGRVALRGNISPASPATLTLTGSDDALRGTLLVGGETLTVEGNAHRLAAATDPPSSTCSSLLLTIERSSPASISGTTSGRCYGTVDGAFEFTRR